MSTTRYNVFNQIHKGLRAFLYDTALCIQQADFSKDNAIDTLAKVSLAVDLFDEHAHHEDQHILPMLANHYPQMVDDFEKDHEIDHNLSEALREYVAKWHAADTKHERMMIGHNLFYAFNEFIAFNLYHMNKEENQLLDALWEHNTDADLLLAQQAIVASIKPEILMIESRWMMKSLNNDEIIKWMTGIKMTAAEEIYTTYLKMAEEELSPLRFNEIVTSLSTQVIPA